MKNYFVLLLVLIVQINFAQNKLPVGTFDITNDGVYNSIINSGNVARINMGFDGAKGYINFGAHTGGGQRSNILYLRGNDGNVGIGTDLPSSKLTIAGGPTDTRLLLHSSGSGVAAGEADLMLWASEPGLGHTGVGIGNNIHNYKTSSGLLKLLNPAKGGSYIRLLDNEMMFNVISSSGVDRQALSINSSGTLHIGKQEAIGNSIGEVVRLTLQPYGHTGGPWAFKTRDIPGFSYMDIGYGSIANALTIKSNGNIGVGTTDPIEKLSVNGGTGDGDSFDAKMALTRVSSTGNIQSAKIVLNDADTNFGNLIFKVKTTASKAELDSYYSDALTIKGSNANIGIGTSNPDEKLTVKGKIHTQEVRVDMQGPLVPDYVFANDYKLKPLKEVENYIKENSHLPEIPSAKEIEKNGLMIAEMNMNLLKKVEELTLYAIEQQKNTEELTKIILEQNKRLEALENNKK